MSVLVLVPAYNEEARIKATIEAIASIADVDTIRVVNDGSTDRTASIARACGVDVLDMGENVGKGEALNRASRAADADIIVFLDGDLGSSAVEAAKIIQPVLKQETDLCIAKFPPPKKKGGFGFVKRLASWGIRQEGFESAEPLSGQRAMTKQVLQDVLPFHSGYGIELGMTIRALRKGYRIMEVPVNMTHAETGRDIAGFLHRGRQFVDVARVILKERGRR